MIASIAFAFAILFEHRPGGKNHRQSRHGNRWKKGKSRMSKNVLPNGRRFGR